MIRNALREERDRLLTEVLRLREKVRVLERRLAKLKKERK